MKVILLTVVSLALANYYGDTAAASHILLHPQDQSGLAINDVPAQDRLHWMRVANTAVYQSGNPCPQAPFGSAIVNTSSNELICSIANAVGSTGDPTLHGEITAIRECTRILKERGQSPNQILAAWKDFSLYTNGEPCTMCASAIRWAGFKEVVYGSSIQTVAKSECRGGFIIVVAAVAQTKVFFDSQTVEIKFTFLPVTF
jgi:tRNA(Arg) A34 adenosine deaminase TadA